MNGGVIYQDRKDWKSSRFRLEEQRAEIKSLTLEIMFQKTIRDPSDNID